MKRLWDHTPQHTVHNTVNYFTCVLVECQGNLFKSLFSHFYFLFTLPKTLVFPPLTKIFSHVKMTPHADVVELVDSLDLGSNARACRFESCHPHQKASRPYCGREAFCAGRTRTHFYASVRWTLAATSSKTGGYLYFSFPLRERKMHIESCHPSFTPTSHPAAS